ncbi:phosphoglycerate mutase [Holotrichia oblita]|uniref:Phosphoglycerate mutase n=1 Tax=Holotrichia oblita TaxID=644536 RepID=A0ACB9SRT5_HOLOL|nr:phosphoglycerate mutase [Holotrichia oblita]
MWSSSKFLRALSINPKLVRTSKHNAASGKSKSKHQKVLRVVMVRHGESEWNSKNLFTGWYDAELSPKGILEAEEAGYTLKKMKICFDTAYTSVLARAIDTLKIIQAIINHRGIPVYKSWRLNERHYGALTGLNKAETAEQYGEDKVKLWRRSYDVPPPAMTPDHPYYKRIVYDTRYKKDPPKEIFPMYESLKLTLERTLPYWEQTIWRQIRKGNRVLIVAHGNSLRGIVKKMENLTDEEIVGVNIPTGIPFQYLLDLHTMKPIYPTRRYLGDPDVVRKATEAVVSQGKAKK